MRFYRQLVLLATILAFAVIALGAYVRLKGAGLGCPDWPGCYGHASPVGAQTQIAAAQQALPSGPVTHGKAWVEMVHRYLATAVGVLIIALTVGAWRQRARRAGGVRVFRTLPPRKIGDREDK